LRYEWLVRRLLFLCTGNYYRSRFAEVLWNEMERQSSIGWRAESRGLCLALGLGNLGPISRHTVRALRARGIELEEPIRAPLQVVEEDFLAFDRAVAMSASEHRPMVRDQFPAWIDAVEYWDIDDVAFCEPQLALDKLEGRIRELRASTLARPT
jgi:low molecular weight protein-tyrosine phosphatase